MSMRATEVRHAMDRLKAAAGTLQRPVTFMEVCGTHTMSAFRCGLHSAMPDDVRLLSGPGCPVCVTAQGDIDQLIDLVREHDVTMFTYGDMVRVPGTTMSLERARSDGANVKVAYSTLDAVRYAAEHRDQQVVFASVGFETTAPATAAAVLDAAGKGLTNFSVLTSHKRVMPAMMALLAGGKVNLDGFLCPGHVSIIIGSDAYRPIVDQYRLPCVVAGFEDLQMARGMATLTELAASGEPALVNEYEQVVTPSGNRAAMALLERVFQPADVRWRGIGVIPDSGMVLRPEYHPFDAARKFQLTTLDSPEPPGCQCGQVITGMMTPPQCKLFATSCTPMNPIGPCMVSSEGTCHAWFKYRRA